MRYSGPEPCTLIAPSKMAYQLLCPLLTNEVNPLVSHEKGDDLWKKQQLKKQQLK